MASGSLNGRVALIVGGSGGIGSEISMAMGRAGATVAVGYKSGSTRAHTIVSRIVALGSKAMPVRLDTVKESDVKQAVTNVVRSFGRFDILVNSAGVNPVAADLVELNLSTWQRVLEVDLTGPFLCCKYAAQHMIQQRSGRILNVSSIFGIDCPARRAAYGAAKHGLVGLTQSIARELAPYRITVNAICPGPSETPLLRDIWTKDARKQGISLKEFKRRKLESVPAGRLANLAEIADLAVFLASDMAGYITGSAIAIAGGLVV
jgi:NAD(P)-dependent dehydrogenase (short-subunit alcohol dehydrogenase family)